jgi:dolichyl-phosphate beta-glucosyltransferase
LPPKYSIVIPAYNEGARLAASLEKVLSYIHAEDWNAEIIVVNDGSRDNTAEIIRAFAAKDPIVRLVENPGNRGKGYSVRHGILNARGEVLIFSDADLSSPIEESSKLLKALDENTDIAIGSRWLRVETQTQRQPVLRQIFGRISICCCVLPWVCTSKTRNVDSNSSSDRQPSRSFHCRKLNAGDSTPKFCSSLASWDSE